VPRFKKVALTNLDLAFPEKDRAWKEEIVRKSYASLARLLVDFARIHQLDREWLDKHVDGACFVNALIRRKAEKRNSFVVLSGHLGSFELLGQVPAVYGHPISFVARDFKLPRLNAWWRSRREKYGGQMISRKGAFKEVLRQLQEGRDVGILFDQNLTRQRAVFVDWFGVKAATTKTVAFAAIRAEASVLIVSISYIGDDKYKSSVEECDFREIYSDDSMTLDQKIEHITQVTSKIFEGMIRKSPHEWFWMHRRWKTRPNEDDKSLYQC